MSLKLDTIRLLVTKFDDCFLFYRDVMGFEVTWGDMGSGYASFKISGGGRLSIFMRGEQAMTVGTANLPSEAKAQDSFVLVLRSRNVDKRLKRMKGKCTGQIIGPDDYPGWGIRAAYLRDPDGMERYDAAVVAHVTSPLTGLQRKCKFPPSIAEVVEECERVAAEMANIARLRAMTKYEGPARVDRPQARRGLRFDVQAVRAAHRAV